MSCGSCRLCFGTKPAYQSPHKEPKMSETAFATALDSLGEILPSDPGRDAVHLATYAVTAGERLFPGQHIGLTGDTASSTAGRLLGIVDPFLATTVFPGQMFWMVLYPRTITSLRHVWTHPEFSAETATITLAAEPAASSDLAASEAWLRMFTETHDSPRYDTFMAALKGEWPPTTEDDDTTFLWGGWDDESLHFGGVDAHSDIPPEFWDHVSIVLGKTIAPEKRAKHFACSC